MKLTGEMGAFRRDPLGMLERCKRDLGDVARIRFGISNVIILSHPDLVEEVLVTHNQAFRKNPATRRLGSLIGRGLLSSDGDAWRRQRRLTQPAFHRAKVNAAAGAMVDYAQQHVATWRDGDTRDVHPEMMELTLQIACKTLFGAEVAADLEVVRQATAVVGAHFLSRLTSLLFLLPDRVPTPGNRRYLAAVATLDELVYRMMRDGPSNPDSLLGMLLDSGMADEEIRDEVMTFFMAGHETTALALTWALYLLAKHDDKRACLFEEVDDVLRGRPPTVDDVSRLPYSRAVVDEALRLYPPAYLQGRQALRDVTIGGHAIEQGTTVLMSQWLIHRDARFFDAPDEFRPERWLDGTLAKTLPRFAYFPFGGGQRQCIGNAFAQLEGMLLLACLAQRLRLDLVPQHPVEPYAVVTLRPKYGVQMRSTVRDPEHRRLGATVGQLDVAGPQNPRSGTSRSSNVSSA
jgi:cytochrome P450